MTLIKQAVLNACKHASVAAVASIDSAEWASAHVFYTTDKFIGPVNIGRLPFITVSESNVDYIHETQPNHGGTRVYNFTIGFYVRAFNFNTDGSRDLIEDLIRAVSIILRGNTSGLDLGNESRSGLESTPYGFKTFLSFTTESSFDNTYAE